MNNISQNIAASNRHQNRALLSINQNTALVLSSSISSSNTHTSNEKNVHNQVIRFKNRNTSVDTDHLLGFSNLVGI